MSKLYSIGAKSQEELEDAEYEYKTAMSSLEGTQSNLAETVITAPMIGIVVGEPKTPGAYGSAGHKQSHGHYANCRFRT